MIRAVLTKRVCLALTNYAMLAFTAIAHAGVYPLFLFTPVRFGGLGFSERQVGQLVWTASNGKVPTWFFPDWDLYVISSRLDYWLPDLCLPPTSASPWYCTTIPDCCWLLYAGLPDVPGVRLASTAKTSLWIRRYFYNVHCSGCPDTLSSLGKPCT